MTGLAAELAVVQRAYREGILPVLGARWRPGRSHEGNVWAQTGTREDWKDDFPLLSAKTEELAAEVCESHNGMLDLAWLLDNGWLTQLGEARDPGNTPAGYYACVRRMGGIVSVNFTGDTVAEAAGKAREWAEGEGAS